VKTLCTTLQYFKDYSDTLVQLYRRLTPSYNAIYAKRVINALTHFSAHSGDERHFADNFAMHCLEDIKRLVMTMQEEEFIRNKFQRNDELAEAIQNLLLRLQTQLGQAGSSDGEAQRIINETKHQHVKEVELAIANFRSQRQGVLENEEMSEWKAPKKEMVKVKVDFWEGGSQRRNCMLSKRRAEFTMEELKSGASWKLKSYIPPSSAISHFSYLNIALNDTMDINSEEELQVALEQYDASELEWLEVTAELPNTQQAGVPYGQSSPLYGQSSPLGGFGDAFGTAAVQDNRQPCRYFELGQCKNGDRCRYSHQIGGAGIQQGPGNINAGIPGTRDYEARRRVVADLQNVVQLRPEQLQKLYDDFMAEAAAKPGPRPGCISRQQLVQRLRTDRTLRLTPDKANQVSGVFDNNGDGWIDVQEFILGISALMNSAPVVRKLDFIFRMYDADGNQQLDRREVQRMVTDMCNYGSTGQQAVDPTRIQEIVATMFDYIDVDGNGSIDSREFRQLATEPRLAVMCQEILQILSFGN